jgi:hypothetical protein
VFLDPDGTPPNSGGNRPAFHVATGSAPALVIAAGFAWTSVPWLLVFVLPPTALGLYDVFVNTSNVLHNNPALAGVDMCYVARPMMFAVGCIQARRCNTDKCPIGAMGLDDPSKLNSAHIFRRVGDGPAQTYTDPCEYPPPGGLLFDCPPPGPHAVAWATASAERFWRLSTVTARRDAPPRSPGRRQRTGARRAAIRFRRRRIRA